MNKLDDFLKHKLENVVPDIPTGWEALSASLPAKKSGRILAVWVFSLLVIGGAITTMLVTKSNPSIKLADGNVIEPKVISTHQFSTTETVKSEVENETALIAPASITASVKSTQITPKLTVAQTKQSHVTLTTYEPIANNSIGNSVKIATSEGAFENKALSVVEDINAKSEELKAIAPELQDQSAATTQKRSPNKTSKSTVHAKPKGRGDFHKGKLFVSATISLVGSYRSFALNKGGAPFVNKQYDYVRQNSEQARVTHGATLALEFRFLPNFSIQSGISYSKLGFLSNFDFEVSDKAITDNNGRIIGYEILPIPLQVVLNSKTNFSVLRIPVGLNYNLLFNTNSLFHLYLGGSQNILLSADGVGLNSLTMEQKAISKTDFVNTARELCFGLGVNFALSPLYGIGVDLSYNKYINNISKNNYENIAPFSGGINVSVGRKIF